MIKTIRIAYAIGFSDALASDVISAYHEIIRYQLEGDAAKVRRLKRAYFRGFKDGTRLILPIRYEFRMKVAKLNIDKKS